MKFKQRLKIIILFVLASADTSAFAQTGYTKLFDGKTLSGWKTIGYAANFKAVNGAIVGEMKPGMGTGSLITEKPYSDFVLEMDVKIDGDKTYPAILLRSHIDPSLGNKYDGSLVGYSCDIEDDARQWSGGIYDHNRRGWLYPTDLNPTAKSAFRSGAYNHFKIECIGNQIKTWVNGVPTAYVVDTLNSAGFIGLSVSAMTPTPNSKKAWFKNISIKTTGLTPEAFPANIYVRNLQSNSLIPYEIQNGWKLLFDGKTSEGWHSPNSTNFPTKGWDTNGALSVVPAEKDHPLGGDIITRDQYSAFDLSFEFKITPGANSGVKYFVTVDDKHGALGLEYQVLDDELHPDAKLGRFGNRKQASLYDLIPAKKPAIAIKPVGEWNTGRVTVTPTNHVTHYINGVKVLEYDRGSQAFKDSIAISKYKDYPGFGLGQKGYILLQDHGGAVSFRSIKIKTL